MSARRKTILIIDDNPEDRATVRRYLAKSQANAYQPVEAASAAEGLAMALASAPDCVLLDYNLPDHSGLELLPELVGVAARPNIPVVMLTGGGSEEAAVQAMRLGALDYLNKDRLTGESLRRAIDSVIEKAALLRQIEEQREHLLARERAARQRAEQVATRLARLQLVTSALSSALLPSQVAQVFVEHAITAAGGYSGVIAQRLDGEDTLEVLAASGYSSQVLEPWSRIPLDLNLPIPAAVRTNSPVWLGSPEQARAHCPGLNTMFPSSKAWAALPLLIEGQAIGAIGIAFDQPQPFDPEMRDYILAIAQQCAQSLDRARIYAAERQAREEAQAAKQRFGFLSEASNILAESLDYSTISERLLRLVTYDFADTCMIYLLEGGNRLYLDAATHIDPSSDELLRERLRRTPLLDTSQNPLIQAIRMRQTQLFADTSALAQGADGSEPAYYPMIQQLGITSGIVAPITAQGYTVGVLVFGRVGDKRHYSSLDSDLAEELAHRMAAALDNMRLYREAQALVHSNNELLTVVSHDLKNPLSVMLGYTQMLQRRLQRLNLPEGEQITEGLQRIDAAAVKMARQINELLDDAREHAGAPSEIVRKPADLVALARQVVDEFRDTTTVHRLVLDAAEPAVNGLLDVHRIERALSNLLSNAIKYSPNGGDIVVQVSCHKRASQSWALVSVRDQGIGIPAADLPHVFKRFHRGGNVVERIGGTGIGLASVRQIVEQHGGEVLVSSQEGAGTLVTVQLPLGSSQP